MPSRTPVTPAVVPPSTPITPTMVPALMSPRHAITPVALSPEPTVILDDDHSCNPSEDFIGSSTKASANNSDLGSLGEMFPNITDEQLGYLYKLSGSALSLLIDCMLEGLSCESILCVAALQRSTDDTARIRLQRDDTTEDWVEAVLAFYKQGRFDKTAAMCVCICGQPAIDAGGVRRQFFAVVFGELAQTELDFSLYKGPPLKLWPVFKASILSPGVLCTVGTMIAHSLLLDGQGFPYLSEYCYYYVASHCDRAVTCVTIDDVGRNVKAIVEKVGV